MEKIFLDKARIAREILSYLVDHPEAQDTIDGIIEWWMLERKIEFQVSAVQNALTELKRHGLIIESKPEGRGKAGRAAYCINRDKINVIHKFLESDSPEQPENRT